jgi:alpha-beta hydrolase superfamily lysophospholipase
MKKNIIVKVGKITLGAVVALIVVGTIGMAKLVSDSVLYQNKGNDTQGNSVKQLATYGYDLDGFNAEYSGKEIAVTTEDGNAVPGTYFDMDSDKCVVLVHGAGGDRVSTYPLAQQYAERGYDVIAFDDRGHGLNPDEKVTFGINEALDVKALVKYARKDLGSKEVIVHGQSMGAQVTAIYASNVTPGTEEAADAVICDSPVPGMEYMVRSVIADDDPKEMESFVTSFLTDTSKLYSRLFYGVNWDEGDTIKVVANDQLPTLVFVSEKDTVCLPEKVEEVYENVGSPVKSIAYVNSKHIEGVIDDPAGYMEYVDTFLANAGL